jgi:hypothetical protein
MRHSASRRRRPGPIAARWRTVRRNLRFAVTAVVVIAFILALALYVRSDDGGSDPPVAAGPAGPDPLSSAPAVTPSPSPASSPATSARRSPAGPAHPATGMPSTLPRLTITPGEPGGFTYVPLPTHKLVLRATSSRPIGGVGYLVPTSSDHAYGKALKLGTSWSLQTVATGKPYYAALFVQSDGTGTPITCTIVLDGRVASRLTTSGPYGRQVCIA